MIFDIETINDIKWIKCRNKDNFRFEFCSFGASIYSLDIGDIPLVLEFENKEDFLYSNCYHNKTLGRVAGRIQSPITIDDKKYDLKLEPGFTYSLHGGGNTSLSYKNFDVRIEENEEFTDFIFTNIDIDGENGFPGNLKTVITYRVYEEGHTFEILFSGVCDKKTLISYSNHLYFIFNNDNNLSSYKLKMNCSKYGVVDKTIYIINEEDVPKELDFREGAILGDKLDIIEKKSFLGTIDNTFLFDGDGVVELDSENISLKLTTDFNAMNIYLDNSLKPFIFKNNKGVNLRRAIALEPQLFIFDINDITFDKGKEFKYKNRYEFTIK